jgi:two-component system chemotaxis response regulator CheB
MMIYNRKVNIVIINDSPYFLSLLGDIIRSEPRFNVYAKFANASIALNFIINNIESVDVILLDLELPDMDGLSFMEHILRVRFIPIIVITAYNDSWIHDKVLESGAVDAISVSNIRPDELKSKLIERIDFAIIFGSNKISIKSSMNKNTSDLSIVVIGASTGAPAIVADILAKLPIDINACIMVIQHMPKGFTDNYAGLLASKSKLKVKIAEDNDKILKGLVLIAPADYHMIVEYGYITLYQGPKYAHVRPSVNVTMITAARNYGKNVIGVLLSGMGFDGALGMKVIKSYNGYTIAQDKDTSLVYGMAKVAHNANAVDITLPAYRIAEEIVRLTRLGGRNEYRQ